MAAWLGFGCWLAMDPLLPAVPNSVADRRLVCPSVEPDAPVVPSFLGVCVVSVFPPAPVAAERLLQASSVPFSVCGVSSSSLPVESSCRCRRCFQWARSSPRIRRRGLATQLRWTVSLIPELRPGCQSPPNLLKAFAVDRQFRQFRLRQFRLRQFRLRQFRQFSVQGNFQESPAADTACVLRPASSTPVRCYSGIAETQSSRRS